MLKMLNLYEIPNEYVHAAAVAVCALLSIAAIHSTMEGFLVRGDGELSCESVAGFVLLRSFTSLGRLWAHVAGHPVDPAGELHRPGACACARAPPPTPPVDTMPGASGASEGAPGARACRFARPGAPASVRIVARTGALWALILGAEVAFMCLALKWPERVGLGSGKAALTVFGNNFGAAPAGFGAGAASPAGLRGRRRLGCREVFRNEALRLPPRSVNRITQLVLCTVKLRAANVARGAEVAAASRAPPGFSVCVLDLDVSGDDIVLYDVARRFHGAEAYAYWKSTGTVVEGAVPLVPWGTAFSPDRTGRIAPAQLAELRHAVNARLRARLGKAYVSAYGAHRAWAAAGDSAGYIRTVLYLDMRALAKHFAVAAGKEDELLGHVLNELVELQMAKEPVPQIFYANGVRVLNTNVTGGVVEYIVSAPVLGLVPWAILTVVIMVAHSWYNYLNPNYFFEYVFNVFRKYTGVAYGPPLMSIPGKLLFTPDVIYFVYNHPIHAYQEPQLDHMLAHEA